jgi:hypothetical protein
LKAGAASQQVRAGEEQSAVRFASGPQDRRRFFSEKRRGGAAQTRYAGYAWRSGGLRVIRNHHFTVLTTAMEFAITAGGPQGLDKADDSYMKEELSC